MKIELNNLQSFILEHDDCQTFDNITMERIDVCACVM